MWIPEAVYERLPRLYLLAACASLTLSGPALVSAGLFLAAALLTWHWRRDYRNADNSGYEPTVPAALR